MLIATVVVLFFGVRYLEQSLWALGTWNGIRTISSIVFSGSLQCAQGFASIAHPWHESGLDAATPLRGLCTIAVFLFHVAGIFPLADLNNSWLAFMYWWPVAACMGFTSRVWCPKN